MKCSYFALRNFRISHCEIFVFHILKFLYYILRSCDFFAFRICEILKLRKMKKFLKRKLFFAMQKAKYSHFAFVKIANFERLFRLQCKFCNEYFWNLALRKFLQETYLKAILNKFHLYWIASCRDIQRALMAEQWTVKMNYNGAPILKISKFYIS